MRAASTLLGMLASAVTIFAAVVRLWWSKPRPTPPGEPDLEPKAPSWLATAAKVWLIAVITVATLGGLAFVIYSLVSMTA